jgi:hypothetical protein
MTAEKPKGEDIDRRYGLEPVFEPGAEAGSDALEGFVDVACPYCNEPINVRVDLSAGAQTYVEDCQVCCQPMAMSVRVSEDGQLSELLAERMD